MPERVVLACDGQRCNAEDGVRRWTIALGQDATEVLLCAKHAAPLAALRALGRPTVVPSAPKRQSSTRGVGKTRLDGLVQR